MSINMHITRNLSLFGSSAQASFLSDCRIELQKLTELNRIEFFFPES